MIGPTRERGSEDDQPYDIIHSHVAAALPLARFAPAPLVYTLHHERDEPLTSFYVLQRGVRMVALSQVDNAGVTRVKSVPVSLLERATRFGVGMSPVFEVFVVDDTITSSDEVGGPVGDLRLMPDPNALRVLAAQPGWAWAPVDKHTQEGEVYAGCQRTFAKRMVRRATDAGIEVRMAFELEWFQAQAGSDVSEPVHAGPAYGLPVLATISDAVRDLVVALE